MYNKSIFIVTLLVSVLCIAVSSYALEYSADTVFTANGQKMYGKMNAKEDRFVESWFLEQIDNLTHIVIEVGNLRIV